ncbi:uncharacterized protein PAN0_004d2292 [Moesziomyces antarcticus]|uniref:Uncharacterized protein n=2 Tax=Pseudozyma antarctica TaxID=84753 RepID=A0A5C3FK10_PSEA2|nr:uncharacterized protein PAN0_004d2292 [Moesziomyces antarcticus]GAK64083.1 conserved hypothetical protein [Moesziomyces antarcticus]SPO44698.1 uncharacterized protein PSANT_02384 [Moesziomyces antarcticus]
MVKMNVWSTPAAARVLKGTSLQSFSVARRVGTVRYQSRGAPSRDASQPAPLAQPAAPASSPATPRTKPAGAEDERSRLARLQAQRLEELNRGRAGGARGGARSNRPEQRWSNRTLIALATSVGACTYLMGTYHGYNAGKAHVIEQAQAPVDSPTPSVTSSAAASIGTSANSIGFAERALTSLSDLVAPLVPFRSLASPLHCEQGQTDAQTKAKTPECRLAELTQYHCDLHPTRVVCQPIDRIFRICKGRPAVEVSHIVEFDESAKPYLPAHLSCGSNAPLPALARTQITRFVA